MGTTLGSPLLYNFGIPLLILNSYAAVLFEINYFKLYMHIKLFSISFISFILKYQIVWN